MNRHFWDSGSTEVENDQSSSLSSVQAGVLQSSVLGPSHFLKYINDQPKNLESLVRLLATDYLFSNVCDP